MKKHPLSILLFFTFYFLLFNSCKKESFITSSNASIATSANIITFDTVFTHTGSVTQIFTINNTNNQKLLLSTVQLMGGSNSAFTININGVPGPVSNNITIQANDSIYVFVTVNINPNAAHLPFIVQDSILISFNGNNRFVQLQAYGQNAHFFTNKIITGDTTWTNDLPYVISDSLQIANGATLTISKGCRIYSHADAPFLVNGTLVVNGTKSDTVTFTGDRLDTIYNSLPASWPGIYFRAGSINNVLTHAVIKNADNALVVYGLSTNSNPKVILHKCIISNAYNAGIFCYNTSLDADNSLVSNCGNDIILSYGGNYNFYYCTGTGYGNSYVPHKNPVLQATNYDSSAILTYPLKAAFYNCIFWGDDNGIVDDEVVVSTQGSSPDVLFDHVLYRAKEDPVNSNLVSVITNQDPMFINVDEGNNVYNFRLSQSSVAIDAGIDTIPSFATDLDDSARIAGTAPDLGCYEKQ